MKVREYGEIIAVVAAVLAIVVFTFSVKTDISALHEDWRRYQNVEDESDDAWLDLDKDQHDVLIAKLDAMHTDIRRILILQEQKVIMIGELEIGQNNLLEAVNGNQYELGRHRSEMESLEELLESTIQEERKP